MTEEQDENFSGWASPQLTGRSNAKENRRKREREKNIPRQHFAPKHKHRESKHSKGASRHHYGIDTNRKLATNRKTEFNTRPKEASKSRCESRQMRHGSSDLLSLSWQNSYPIIPVESEDALLPILFPWGKTERGMIKTQPPFRVQQIRKSCKLHGQLKEASYEAS